MSNTPATLLIVDDDVHVRELLELLLQDQGYRTLTASSGEQALAMVAQQAPDLILLDAMLPGTDGYQVARQLKANQSTANIPIIMLSALGEQSARLLGLEAGAEDFLSKPVASDELWLRVRNLLRLKAFGDNQAVNTLMLEQQLQKRTIDLERFRTAMGGDERLLKMVNYDPLTGLPNRNLFYTTLQMGLTQAELRGWQLAVVTVGLNDLKNINQTWGHAMGDQVLAEFSHRLSNCLNVSDTLGRMDGDELALILMIRKGQPGPRQMVDRIREVLREPFKLPGHDIPLTACIGIALYPDDGADAHRLIKHANTAMGRSKLAGRDTYRFYTAQMNVEVLARQELETALRDAVRKQAFEVYYQPKIGLVDGQICGVEALLRWHRPGMTTVSPAVFVPVLESLGLISHVGQWVIDRVCNQISIWQQAGLGQVEVAVNVSAQQISEGDLVNDIQRSLKAHQLEPQWLEVELTEGSLLENTPHTVASLLTLRDIGVKISIDDFGTGYSSLAYLSRFPIDKLKIDIAFIREVTNNPQDAAIARTIIELAHSLELEVIAEGVETVEQLEFLTENGCDQVQGYLFCRPLPPLELEALLRDPRCFI
ncbi:putative bifunctional diguanylate cyclase/phosphodiesterase [Pseudomonas deceptionensis]|uniref:cyclic-guanylate-specific phosphodiesterase n=1 Tax=Pseudomonas deceptionensis TaxID=882211 RepID=A0A0J6GEK0_PSEDM|nr:EAL domain-containing protein [Pseudomonas deceptionensis]KMM80718.1 diguanylate phosphodiesterase [Pseudomonas deceptionensis]SEE92207.1 diguanylate cyclase (GGDEF) domain-containing protein [Pseudomonas deceptionensis]